MNDRIFCAPISDEYLLILVIKVHKRVLSIDTLAKDTITENSPKINFLYVNRKDWQTSFYSNRINYDYCDGYLLSKNVLSVNGTIQVNLFDKSFKYLGEYIIDRQYNSNSKNLIIRMPRVQISKKGSTCQIIKSTLRVSVDSFYEDGMLGLIRNATKVDKDFRNILNNLRYR